MRLPPVGFRLDLFIPYRLMVAAEKVSLGFSVTYKKQYGLNRPEWRVLASLAQLGKATAKDIGVHSSMHKTKVSRAVFELERRKWLTRSADENDRRVEHLALTKAGVAVHGKLAVQAERYQQDILARLGSGKGGQLIDVLDRLDVLFSGQDTNQP